MKDIKEISKGKFKKLIISGVIKGKHMYGNIPEEGRFSSGYFTKSDKHIGVIKTRHHFYIDDYYVNEYGY